MSKLPIDNNHICKVAEGKEIDTMIGLPSWQGGLEPDTQTCLDKLIYYNVKEGNLVTVKKTFGSMIAENRNKVIQAAIEANTKYVLFIDTDMVFPEDAIQLMKGHFQPIVSALAVAKTYPHAPNMYEKDGAKWKPILKWKDCEMVSADCVGGAFLLVETDVFRNIKPPWFASPPVKNHFVGGEVEKLFSPGCDVDEVVKAIRAAHAEHESVDAVLGEDYYFSIKAKAAGYPIYCDTALKIGHIGKYVFSYNDLLACSEAGAFDSPIHGG